MGRRCSMAVALVALVTVGAGAVGADGPDAIVGELTDVRLWGGDGVETAYSIGHVICNVGTEPLPTEAVPSTAHPVFGQNLFRLSADGRFEQIGQAWLPHLLCSLQQNACGHCDGGAGCQSVVHPGCSSPNSSAGAGVQSNVSPKWQVNPHTGAFEVPWDQGEGITGVLSRRLRARNADLDPELNPGARYFVEGQYITPDDAAAGNANNSVSHREVIVESGTLRLLVTGSTRRRQPAIDAWLASDPDVSLTPVPLDDDGLFVVGSRVVDNRDGTWTYDYAVYNMNVHRAARAFTIPVPAGVTVTDVGFHDVDYHSGDGVGGVNVDGTDWTVTAADGAITWSTDAFKRNENANALRWGTLYSFRFTADRGPGVVEGGLDPFRPGDPGTITFPVDGPAPLACPADLDGNGTVDVADLLRILAAWGPCPPEGDCPEDLDDNGRVEVADLLLVLAAWGPCDG